MVLLYFLRVLGDELLPRRHTEPGPDRRERYVRRPPRSSPRRVRAETDWRRANTRSPLPRDWRTPGSSPALNDSAEPQQCGASSSWYASASAAIRRPSVGPPQIARSGCSTSTASISIRSRKSNRVNSLSPAAIAMLVEARTAAAPRRSSALTGSSNHRTPNGSTPAAKRLASDGAERAVRVDHQADVRPERGACRLDPGDAGLDVAVHHPDAHLDRREPTRRRSRSARLRFRRRPPSRRWRTGGMSARHGPPHRSTTGAPSDLPSRSHNAMSTPLIAATLSPRLPSIGKGAPATERVVRLGCRCTSPPTAA